MTFGLRLLPAGERGRRKGLRWVSLFRYGKNEPARPDRENKSPGGTARMDATGVKSLSEGRDDQSSSGNMAVTTGSPWSPGLHSGLSGPGDVPLSTCRGPLVPEALRPWFVSKNFGRSEEAAVALPIKE